MWEEEEEQSSIFNNNQLVDVAFSLNCTALPSDHAWILSQAISNALPWFKELQTAGLHLIHVAESGNGWQRPDNFLYLSKRTKLHLRIPTDYLSEIQTLCGKQFDIGGYLMTIKKYTVKKLSPSPVLFSRYVLADEHQSEEMFIKTTLQEVRNLGVQCRKMLAGLTHHFQTPQGILFTRSLMLADLPPEDSLLLQIRGLGSYKTLGFGLFVPHKDIKAIGQTIEKKS
jgi:CRISPR-associated protein Cas6